MGIFDDVLDFFSGTSKTSEDKSGTSQAATSTQRATDETERESTSSQDVTSGETTAATSGKTIGETQLFTDADRARLDELLGLTLENVESTTGSGALGEEIAKFIFTEAKNAPDLAESAGLAAEDLARLEFERVAVPAIQQQANRAGSTENTLIDQLTARAGEDLAVRLAGIRTGAALQGNELATRGGAFAADAASRLGQTSRSAFSNVIDALNLARGSAAVTTETAEQLQTSDVFQERVVNTEKERTLKSLIDLLGVEDVTQTGNISGSQGSSIVDFLPLFTE